MRRSSRKPAAPRSRDPIEAAAEKREAVRLQSREAALNSLTAFVELVWKDEAGQPINLSEIHRVELDFIQRAFERLTPAVILAGMGTGKTTIGLAVCAWLLAKYPNKRLGILSDIDMHAEDRLAVLRHYIETDADFKDLFPEVQMDRSKRGRRTISKFRLTHNIYAKDPSCFAHGILASGTGSRMDFLFADDLCTERNSILSPADRERVKKGYFGTFRNRLDPPFKWTFYIGTLYHQEDLTHALLGNKATAHLKIDLHPETLDHYTVTEWWPGDEEPKVWDIPLWEPKWSKETYEQTRDEMAALGDLSKFFSAYCGLIVDPTKAAFTRAWFERSFEIHVPKKYLFRVLYADPATAQDKKACYYSGAGLGWDAETEKATVLLSWREKEGLTSRVDRYLDAYDEIRPHWAAVEGKHEGAFAERIEERAIERGTGFRLIRVAHDTDKEARIGSLAPLLQHAKILVDLERWPYFWKEASVFPFGRMDALDALEGGWSLIKRWLKSRAYVPTKFPVSRQYGRRGMVHKGYSFESPRSRRVQASHRNLADHFFG